MTRELTGRHVLTILIISFGVVFAVNGYFTYVAIGSFPGIEEDNTYRRGLAFNEQIARSRALEDLGWDLKTDIGPDGTLMLRFSDREGERLAVSAVSATLFHPTAAKDDTTLDLHPAGPGAFTVPLAGIAKGQRELRIMATGPGGQTLEFRRKLWIE